MNDIREFVRSGGGAVNDSGLMTLLREGMLMAPLKEQRGWLRDVELVLGAYGAQAQVAAAVRVRSALDVLSQDLVTAGR